MQNQRTLKKEDETIYFVICNGCYWCASIFGEHKVPASCSECGRDLETMSLSQNEHYTLDIKKNNVLLCFS